MKQKTLFNKAACQGHGPEIRIPRMVELGGMFNPKQSTFEPVGKFELW